MDSRFPIEVVKDAQDAQDLTGCLTSVTLAQWALESDYGRRYCAVYNPFGIKARDGDSYTIKNTHEWNGKKYIPVVAKFRNFPSLREAFIEHGRMLMNPTGYYRRALPEAADYTKFIDLMAPIYATDPNYASKLLALIKQYDLSSVDLPQTEEVDEVA